jgi:hypothetical protein
MPFEKGRRKEVQGMMVWEPDRGLDFEALRLAIEGCDPDLVLGFYAENAQLSIVNLVTPHVSPFELRGKAEIAKHLQAAFGQETSHRVEGEIVGEDRVTFREACEYPDGGRVLVETTLEVKGGKIVRQVDVVAKNPQAERDAGIGQRPPTRNTHPETHPGMETPLPDRLLRSKQATEKEERTW